VQKVCFSGQKFLNTLILSNFYLSLQGEESFHHLGITAFGQSFSHAIALYACDENLLEIMGRVSIKAFFNTVKNIVRFARSRITLNQIHYKIYNSQSVLNLYTVYCFK
jgi:hypothetical protein